MTPLTKDPPSNALTRFVLPRASQGFPGRPRAQSNSILIFIVNTTYTKSMFWNSKAVFPNHFRLAAPYRREMQFTAPTGKTMAICFKVWWHFENSIFNDVLKNALARAPAEYRKLHPVGKHLSLIFYRSFYFYRLTLSTQKSMFWNSKASVTVLAQAHQAHGSADTSSHLIDRMQCDGFVCNLAAGRIMLSVERLRWALLLKERHSE